MAIALTTTGSGSCGVASAIGWTVDGEGLGVIILGTSVMSGINGSAAHPWETIANEIKNHQF